MKKVSALLLCLMMVLSCCVVVSAHEGHDDSTTVSTATLSPDLDQDQDGIADYMDPAIDLDGDGIGDVGPTYQQPPTESKLKKPNDFPWTLVICVSAFLGLIAATVILKALSKKKKEDDHVQSE